ncbi:YebC/PmpR family DNA-binding transcriptional regulator [Murdochiella vaginalis]|uniref:YebC/PmpR family DNA-binding transcriptional regulator n=1 Tax=Murdochiella vaginalis TaxID=1852373 RepID=UPI0008FE7F99|nr:YebC/PmpR family DNA-binding transcriptional regulator [Murdochiella vaginalis]
MSGHNKWSKVKNVKGKEDAKRASAFTKISRMIMVAVREGGGDPDYNASLKMAIEKAKAENMPNDNINRAIKKGLGDLDGQEYSHAVYEGYGPEGVAVIVSCLTDNKNRTAANVRHYFDKYRGNLGTSGSVMFQFDYKGILVTDDEGKEEDTVMMDALDAGAEDVRHEEGSYILLTDPAQFSTVNDTLVEKGYVFRVAETGYLPKNTVRIEDEENQKLMETLVDVMEDDDDVQDVYTNWEQE